MWGLGSFWLCVLGYYRIVVWGDLEIQILGIGEYRIGYWGIKGMFDFFLGDLTILGLGD